MFANNFEVKKKEEIIYFTLSVARDCGFDSKPFHLLGDSNETTINELQTEFEKLSIELIHFNCKMRPFCKLTNISFYKASVNDEVLDRNSQDFGYCLGVLHHIPNTLDGIKACSNIYPETLLHHRKYFC